MTTLRNTITELASDFADGVLKALRSASLADILSETNRSGGHAAEGVARRGPGRPRGTGAGSQKRGGGEEADRGEQEAAAPAASGGRRRGRRAGRLGRRSAGDIGALVERIVTLLGQNPNGLRAEEIRQALGIEAKELPRPIADALAQRKIMKQGQKRATTYFARGAKGASPAAAASERGGKRAGRGGGKAGRPARKARANDEGASSKRGGRKSSKRGRRGRKGNATSGAATVETSGTETEGTT